MRKLFAGLILCSAAWIPEKSVAQNQDDLESDPRGAVLCVWMIYSSIYSIGNRCSPDEDREFLVFLNEGIRRIDQFIIRNSDTTQTTLDFRRKQIEENDLKNEPGMCEPGGESMKFYTQFRNMDRTRITASLDGLLEVDRKPLANPCL